jgi:Ca2+-binding EF-hand superfamily protein
VHYFEKLTLQEARALTVALDADDSGDVSVDEFRSFVVRGIAPSKRAALQGAGKGGQSGSDPLELLTRHLTRISAPDGGIDGLLAFLDSDEDGLISVTSFMRVLRREGVTEDLTEEQCATLLKPAMRGDNFNVVTLLRLLDGTAKGGDDDDDDADKDAVDPKTDPAFEFSRDPLKRSLEKKLRGLGRTLAKKGVDVEGLFRSMDSRGSGMIRRSDMIDVLSKMGIYIIERGNALDNAARDTQGDVRRAQMQQVSRTGKDPMAAAAAAAKKMFRGSGEGKMGAGDFQDHLESMALVNWYRQGQKQMLLQRVLSHSLGDSLQIFPRFGKTLFFEHPLSNPFAHEERFIIEVNDPELRIVVNFEEWLHLRNTCRPCVGELGADPVEAEMFDTDSLGNVQVALLANETLHIPFTFMTLAPYTPPERGAASQAGGRGSYRSSLYSDKVGGGGGESKWGEGKDDDGDGPGGGSGAGAREKPKRTVEVRIISGSHGHVVSVLKVEICPKPFVVSRTLRFFEQENSIMKRRIRIAGGNGSTFPGATLADSKYVHCVDSSSTSSKVVVEWGPAGGGSHSDGMDLLLRYRCMGYPSTGNFYILIYDDPFQSQLASVWQVIVETRQKLDVHSSVGSATNLDLVMKGDRFARRVRTYASATQDSLTFQPGGTFQLVPGAYNRVSATYAPRAMGSRRMQFNVVDVDSRELVASWLVTCSAAAPAVLRTYDVDVPRGSSTMKKIVFKNPWDSARRFSLSSSNIMLLEPRDAAMDIPPGGSAYLRLRVACPGQDAGGRPVDVYLFLNDEAGQNEESYLFRVREGAADIN